MLDTAAGMGYIGDMDAEALQFAAAIALWIGIAGLMSPRLAFLFVILGAIVALWG